MKANKEEPLPLAPCGLQGKPLRGRRMRRRPCTPPASRSPGQEGISQRQAEAPAGPVHPDRTQEHRAMSDDAELELFRASVNCAAVLESMSKGWKLDARQSTRRALKYRRGEGEVLIINHDGRGWWDPLSQAKGDVFNLVQHLDPSLNFGHVRRVLRRMVGMAPSCPAAPRNEKGRGIIRPIAGALDSTAAPAPRLQRLATISPARAHWRRPWSMTLPLRMLFARGLWQRLVRASPARAGQPRRDPRSGLQGLADRRTTRRCSGSRRGRLIRADWRSPRRRSTRSAWRPGAASG